MVAVWIVAVAAGLAVLAKAADQFVLGAADIARRLGVSPIVIGAVVIGFGTSAPELIVSGLAAAGGDADVGIGNIVGSNFANLTLVLGIAAAICPISVSSTALRREAPAALLAMAMFGLFVQGGLYRVEAVVLLVALLAVVVAIVVLVMRNGADPLEDEVVEYLESARAASLRVDLLRTGLGLAGTLVGAQMLVTGAVELADIAGFSGGFVGLTLVAVGTSLPEIVTSVQAARRGEHDLIVGNLLGSNVLNSLAVGGVVGLLAPGAAVDPVVSQTGVVIMLGSAVVVLALLRSGFRVTRGEGITIVAGYSAAIPLLA